MKFYEYGELVAILDNDEAIEHCIECPYCYDNTDGSHTCTMGDGDINLEDELETEEGNQLECWMS